MFSWSWPKDPPADLPPNFVGLNLEDNSSVGASGPDGDGNEELVAMGNPMPDLAG